MDQTADQQILQAGQCAPGVALPATDGRSYDLSVLPGLTVLFAYPRTSPPGAAPIEGWDLIPGARGCTPQSCGFRDHFEALRVAGVDHVFGLSTQDTEYQSEVVERLNLPFPILSDEDLEFSGALGLETFDAGGMTLLKRITMILRNGVLKRTMAPVPEPEQNAAEVLAILKANQGFP